MGRIPINIAEHVGRTPMVQLTRLAADDAGGELFAKLEMCNPGGSVKDRIGVAMIEAAEREGRIEPGRTTIVEATSGNTGIALAFVCAAKGYDLVLTLPQGMSREREGLLRLYGARVHITESMGGMNEAVAAARAMARDDDVWLARAVRQPRQPGGPLRDHGSRDLGGDGRQGRLPRLRRRDGRHRSRAPGASSRSATPRCASSPSSRRPRPCSPAARPGPHKIQGIGAGFVPPVLDRDAARRDHPRRRRGRDRDRAARRARARACWPGSPAAPRCGRAMQVAAPRGGARASGSPSCCPTRASATSRRRSSRPSRPTRRPPPQPPAPERAQATTSARSPRTHASTAGHGP